MQQGTPQQQAAAKVRHIGKKPHAMGHCPLCPRDADTPDTKFGRALLAQLKALTSEEDRNAFS